MRDQSVIDAWHMARALELAARGRGAVEPNPMVGCVIARGAEIIAEGWHRKYGQAHAEVDAPSLAGARAAGSTMYITLEPCCHTGKTPPCSQAVLQAGIRRVVVAMGDPFPQVSGGGIEQLKRAGLEVLVGVGEEAARKLNAPYLKLVTTGRPWVVAKWAMTLDGKIATRSGSSQWISSPDSRKRVHELRGCMDAIVVGSQTAAYDDPSLTARPPGPRTPLRVVLDRQASLSLQSKLAQTAREVPVLVAVGSGASNQAVEKLQAAGMEVLTLAASERSEQLGELLDILGQRRLTNVLFEGGGQVLGALRDGDLIDEVHAFIAPRLAGGAEAVSPMAGLGLDQMESAPSLSDIRIETIGTDVYIQGRVQR